jgi:hypothetical protein
MTRLLLRWLGIPTRADIRAMILREIDADAVWRAPSLKTAEFDREQLDSARQVAIMVGSREDTRG